MNNVTGLTIEDFDDDDEPYRRYTYAQNVSESKVFPTEGEALAWRAAQKKHYEDVGFIILNDKGDGKDDSFFNLPVVEEMGPGRWVAYIDAELIVYEDEDAKS